MKIPNESQIEKLSEHHISKAEAMLEFITNEGTIDNVADYELAPTVVASMKQKRTALDEARRELVDPLNEVVKKINARMKPATDALDEAERLLKDRLTIFRAMRLEKRTEILKHVENADDEMRTALMTDAADLELPKLKGVSFRESWAGEVIDIDALRNFLIGAGERDFGSTMRHFLIPDVKALEAHTKSLKGDVKIPGWRPFLKTVVAISKK